MPKPKQIDGNALSRKMGSKLFKTSGLPLFVTLLVAGSLKLSADTISTNLSNASAGVETATGTTWLTVSFGTGSSAAILQDITLLLANSITGVAELDLYTNGTLQPGSLVGTLTSPATYTSSLSEITFAGDALTLSANSTYWLVLKATTGAFDWSWTADSSGAGIGYQGAWGISADGGITWFTSDTYPMQFSVTTVSTISAAAVPEPGTWVLSGVTLLIGGAWLKRKQKQDAKAWRSKDEN